MRNKRKQPINYGFESNIQTGAFTKICKDMQKSLAWKDLSLRQHRFIFTIKGKIHKI